MISIIKKIILPWSIKRSIKKALVDNDANRLYYLCRMYKKDLRHFCLEWKKTGHFDGCQLLGITRAYEMVHATDSLVLELLNDEPQKIAAIRTVNELFGSFSNFPNEALRVAENILIDLREPLTYGDHVLSIDCHGLSAKCLYAARRIPEAIKMNENGLRMATKCMDLFSQKMFLQNAILLNACDSSGNADESLLRRVVYLDAIMYGV